MSIATPNMGLTKAVDADNARTYLETDLGASLDTLDAHDHATNAHGLPVQRLHASQTAGDLFYASGASALSRLAAGAAGSVLQQGGGSAPGWLPPGSNGQVLQIASGVPAWGATPPTTNMVAFGNSAENGKKLQTGQATTGSESSAGSPTVYYAQASVSFLTTFAATPRLVVTPVGTRRVWAGYELLSTSSVTLNAGSTNSGQVAGVALDWHAVG